MASRAPSEAWRDEKHFRFLNSVEASFVRTVFGNKNADGSGGSDDGGLRLDRYLPDSSESTQDLQSQRRKKTATSSSSSSSDGMGPGRGRDRTVGRTGDRGRFHRNRRKIPLTIRWSHSLLISKVERGPIKCNAPFWRRHVAPSNQ
ncbi:uncharacterized protein LOC104424403 [Eucalyptus grandis]|uniref:uncharacterized protein LOC104424403 n=1 Tax=Eucalyptus grandis TaxID=71139 RepID=UPI00192F0357|nr:uncharacterized protein LOC104424403 [Eucalyptus grandis]